MGPEVGFANDGPAANDQSGESLRCFALDPPAELLIVGELGWPDEVQL